MVLPMVGDELPRAEIGYAGAAALMGGLLRLAELPTDFVNA